MDTSECVSDVKKVVGSEDSVVAGKMRSFSIGRSNKQRKDKRA